MIYNVDEIFEEIPDDPDNVLMKIPEEICNELGLYPNDLVSIVVENDSIIIKKQS